MLDTPGLWRTTSSFKGITQVEAGADGSISLKCDLDSLDRTKRSGVAVAPLEQVADVKPPLDMTKSGLLLSVKVPKGFMGLGKFASGVHAGLIDATGNVFWGPWETVTQADTWVTAAIYPEVSYPLPLAFRSADFDPSRITAVAVRLTVDQATPLRFQGEVLLKSVRIVSKPAKLTAERERVVSALGGSADRKPPDQDSRKDPVPIEVFLQNVGVNYPWPFETYPGIGERPWDAKLGGFSSNIQQIRRDFRYLEAMAVRLVRVFIAGDCRTGFVEKGGTISLDRWAMRDTEALLRVLEEHPKLRLVPVIFDFTMADTKTRERLGLVGERPKWIADEALRRRLLDAAEPLLARFSNHPQVAFIDIFNEPEQINAVAPDAYVSFIREVAVRLRKFNPAVKVTVGSRTSVDAAFWEAADIAWLPTFHWFDKIEIDKLPLGYAPSNIPRNATIVTEVDPTAGVSYALDALWKEGFAGAMFWSLNADDGMPFRGKPGEEFRAWVATHSQQPGAQEEAEFYIGGTPLADTIRREGVQKNRRVAPAKRQVP